MYQLNLGQAAIDAGKEAGKDAVKDAIKDSEAGKKAAKWCITFFYSYFKEHDGLKEILEMVKDTRQLYSLSYLLTTVEDIS